MTTVNPPFTGSYASGLQGLNVSTYNLFGISVSPKLGRHSTATFLSSSDGEIKNVSPDATSFFDDSLRLPKPVTLLTSATANVEVISSDDYRVQEFPSYRLSRQTYGVAEKTEISTPFAEMDEFDPVSYIIDPDALAYPVVMEVPNVLDPFNYDGVIEPLAIRKEVVGNSTFVGDESDPEPTGVRGAISSGQLLLNRKSRSFLASSFYSFSTTKPDTFDEVGLLPEDELLDTGDEMSLEVPLDEVTIASIVPFADRNPTRDMFDSISNTEIKDILISVSTRVDLVNGYPDNDAKSAPCGFEYQNSRGIDSITYGGLLK